MPPAFWPKWTRAAANGNCSRCRRKRKQTTRWDEPRASNQQPHCYGNWFESDQFPRSETAFDAILIILIGSILSRGVSGTAPFFSSVLAAGWLIALHSVFSFMSCRSDRLSRLIKGNPTVLIKDGHVDRRMLRNVHMSEGDLEEDLRKKGLRNASEVSEGRLERDGTLSVLKAS
jgi:hypothetical protein